MSSIATQILSFENFGALESHLRGLKGRYNEVIKKYEETLGYILRDTKPNSLKTQKVQEKWAMEMQNAMAATSAATAATAKGKVPAKKEQVKPKAFGNSKDKEKDRPENPGEWVSIDPMSLFIGPKNRGLAEIYFDSINILRESVAKINVALSVCSALKAKVATAGTTSLIVSFVNDVPTKVLIKSASDSKSKKYTMAFSFAVPAMPVAMRSLALK